jgi:hypothetical protein
LLKPQPGGPGAGSVRVMLRPEQIVRVAPNEGMPVQKLAAAFRGDHTLATVSIKGVRLELRLASPDAVPETLHLRVVGACMAYAGLQGRRSDRNALMSPGRGPARRLECPPFLA